MRPPCGRGCALEEDSVALDFDSVDVLTFDCYGTLIDWEAGLAAAMRAALAPHGVDADDERLLELYAPHEASLEAGPYLRYRDVLARSLEAVAADLGVTATAAEVAAFGASVGNWPPFPDSPAALARLRQRYRLGVITNCDDDLFALSNRRLGVTFDWVITAEQAGGYKPRLANFELAFERIGAPRDRILHVAQSLFHDHVPARQLGLRTGWINRRHGRTGSGATPPAVAVPDVEAPDLASFADLALG